MRSLSILLLGSLVVSLSACLEPAEGLMTVGSVAPEVRTRYLKDVDGDMSKLTTYRYPDERMYQYSIDQALKLGKPVVVEFATPGHCTVCDKQLQMLKAMIAKYGNDVIFLHMDQYKNPQAFTAFQVKGDPWTFIIDANRVVKFQRAGRMLYNEMDYAISLVLPKAEEAS
ncbi:MAG: thioredoxin family protein [Gammaproteobacteria bacterium]|nr:thioredoxin family protein [Gammaproteobacteria bacterium]